MKHGKNESMPDSVATGRYYMGMADYAMGDLQQAEKDLSPLFKSGYKPYNNFLVRAVYVLAMTYESLGQSDLARRLLDDSVSFFLDSANSYSLTMVKGFQAELALRQERSVEAENWLATFDPSPTPMAYGASIPELTAVRILLHQQTPAALTEAAQRLTRLKAYFEKIHNTRFLIEALALQALVFQAQNNGSHAEASLGQAIALAQPGGFMQLFVDLGPGLAKLLNRLDLNEEGLQFAGRILAAFPSSAGARRLSAQDGPDAKSQEGLLDPLSYRELEVLELMARHLTNKEIGDQLFISPGTVKRHTESIYSKLGVHGRREAVAKATGLGIIKA